jgi:NADH dehydrogenase FAD-containing subunit
MKKNKILVVGAGFAGSVIARELAEKNFKITVIEKKKTYCWKLLYKER